MTIILLNIPWMKQKFGPFGILLIFYFSTFEIVPKRRPCIPKGPYKLELTETRIAILDGASATSPTTYLGAKQLVIKD